MDLFEKIERTRFLGRELLVWIWWKSELFEGSMTIRDIGECEVWLDDQLTLEARGEHVERSRLTGSSPSSSPEAKEALRQGKVPTKARISITRDQREFSFVLDGESFALSGVRLPTLLQDEREERFYERMYLLEELDDMVSSLFYEFLCLRVSTAWERRIAPAIKAWVRDEPEMLPKQYLSLATRAMKSPRQTEPSQRQAAPADGEASGPAKKAGKVIELAPRRTARS